MAILQERHELQSLIDRCAVQRDASALLEFVHLFHGVIAATVIKTACRFAALSTDLIDDLIQDTYLRIFADNCRVLKQVRVEDRSRLFGFVQSVAFAVVHDHFRQKHAQRRGGGVPVVAIDAAERIGEGGRAADRCERDMLLDKVDRLLEEVTSPETRKRDRLIFWLNHRSGFSAREIAELPSIKLSEKGVESVLHRLMCDIRARIVGVKQRTAEKGTV